MAKLFFFSFLMLSFTAIKAQKFNSDTVRVTVETKFGELTFFRKNCNKNKLEFFQSGKPIIDEGVEQEAKNRGITQDKLRIKFVLDNSGKLKSCEIVRPSKIESLNIFLLELFNDAIQKLNSKSHNLSCDKKRKEFKLAVTYIAQKTSKGA